MANIKKIEGKTGVSYKITVTQGRDMNGKQIRHYKTWTPDRPMTAKQTEKEVQRVALEFERQIQQGFQPGDHQTFAEYAKYVLELKERSGAKHNTILEYRYLLTRVNEAIGNMKLSDIRPQHLNRLYKDLQSAETRMSAVKATGKKELTAKLILIFH